MYSIPYNFGQSAFGHEHPDHEKCWDAGGFTFIYNILDIAELVVTLLMRITAYILFFIPFAQPAAISILANIPVVKTVFFGFKVISPAAGIPLAAFNCPPILVPPPVTVAGTVNVDCNDEDGFTFVNISNKFVDSPFTLASSSPVVSTTSPDTLGYYEPIIETTTGDSRDLPLVYVWSSFGAWLLIVLFFVISIAVDFLFLLIGGFKADKDAAKKSLTSFKSGAKSFKEGAKNFFKKAWTWIKGIFKTGDEVVEETASNKGTLKIIQEGIGSAFNFLKEKIFTKFIVKQSVKLGAKVGKEGLEFAQDPSNVGDSPLSWFDSANQILPNDAWTTHAFHEITSAGVKTDAKTFKLGKNSVEYFSTAFLTDSATFPFNVYDSEPPTITFVNATGDVTKNITLEANAHYGFKVTSKTLPLIKLGSTVFDKCDLNPTFDYIGPDFFLLTKLKANQYAPWKTSDTAPPGGYNALSSKDIDRVLEDEIKSIKESDYQPKRVAGIDPNQQVEFSNLSTKFSTARHLFSIVTNAEINELLANNTKKVLPTADLTLGSNLTDSITLDEIGLVGSPKLDEETLTPDPVEHDPLRLDNLSPEVKGVLRSISSEPVFEEGEGGVFVGFDVWGDLFEMLIPSTTQGRPNIITDTETANPNVFVDFQIITVEDTIAPNLLVTEDIAIEVNSTNPDLTKHPTIENTKGCFNFGASILCELEIRPPAIFDIADPFPEIFHNITISDPPFVKLEAPNLIVNFTLGVSFIEWKGVDFSGNGNKTKDIVKQIVNIKLNGTNTVSNVFPVNVTVFATVPDQITLIANNTDLDPLKFTIEQDPEKGILDTPIDAVFLTKFLLTGAVSKLTGITNEDITGFTDLLGVFFTDSLGKRVLFQDDQDRVEPKFDLPQTTRPEGISLTGNATFMIGDWKANKIFEVNDTGSTIKEFDISGLFVETDVINKKMISVDQTNGDIFVTDSLNGTITKLVDFVIFDSPKGIEVDTGDSTVYVVDNGNDVVHQFDSSGIFIDSLTSGFSGPTDVTLDSTGHIYVLDTGNNKFQKFDSTLDKVKEFGPKGNGLDFFDSPKGITFNGADIFVADTNNHQIKKISNTESPLIEEYTNSTQKWITAGDQIVLFPFGNSTSVIFDSGTGVTSTLNYTRTDFGNQLGNSWSTEFEMETGQIMMNSSPIFLWLLTNDTKHPQEPDPQDALGVIFEDKKLKIFESHGDSNTTSSEISGLKNNKTYFINLEKLDSDLAAMVVYETNRNTIFGNVTLNISSEISNLQVLQHANDIRSDKDNPHVTIVKTIFNPVVTWLGMCESGPNCDTGTNTSNEFSCTDASCFGVGEGTQIGQFSSPTGVSANSTHIFVTDDHRVQIFTSSGTHSMTLGSNSSGSGDLDFDLPNDIEVAPDGSIIVADSENNRIKIYHGNGTLKTIIKEPDGFGNFTLPSGVGVAPSGNIYVSDTDNNQLVKLDSEGGFVDLWKSSIKARFGDYIEIFELYVPGIHAGALDIKDGKVFIGDWRPGEEKVIVANSLGGKIEKFDISSLTEDPNSIAINNANEIFVTDTPSQKILVLDSDGNEDRILDVNGTNEFELFPTGITTASNIGYSIGSTPVNFSGEKLYVFDNSTEGIYAISDDGSLVELAFSAKHLFSNLNDIAVNATHVFGLNTENNTSKIIQIRWDKGIQETFDNLMGNVTGITIGKNMDSDLIFYTTSSHLFKLDTTKQTPADILVDLSGLDPPVVGFGVATNPVISQLVNVIIPDDISNNLVGPRGLAFSSDNKTMYVSSFGTNEIKVLNATTFEFIEDLSDSTLADPTDIIIGPNGTLLIASSTKHMILEFNQTSKEFEIFAEGKDGIVSPSGLAISPDNLHLFVSNGYDNTIVKVNLFSTTSIVEVKHENGTTFDFIEFRDPLKVRGVVSDFVNATNKGSLQNPQYLAFGPDDQLYVSSFNSNEILRWNLNGQFNGTFVNSTTTDLLNGPTGIEFSPDGEFMFVSSSKTNKVLKFDFNTGGFIGVFSDEQTFAPDGLTFGPSGNLFVSSVGSSEVLEYGDSDVRFYVSDWNLPRRIISFDAAGNQVGSTQINVALSNPGNIVSDSKGRLWIADTGNERLVKLNVVANKEIFPNIPTNNIVEVDAPNLTKINGTDPTMFVDDEGTVFDEFISDVITSVTPKGLSVDNNDNLYVSDWDNHRIVVLSPTGDFLGQVRLNSTFTVPLDITINKTSTKIDDIWVYDENFEANQGLLVSLDVEKQFKVLEFTEELSPFLRGLTTTKNGTSLVTTPLNSGSILEIDKFKSAKFDSRHFIIPLGIDLVNSEIYVSDWKEQRIVKLDGSGNFEQEFDLSHVGFVTTEQGDIEINSGSQFFWITEPRRATLDQVRLNGTALAFPSIGDKYLFFSGVDADKQDNFYVISNPNGTVSKFDLRGTLIADAKDKGFTLQPFQTMVDVSLGLDPLDPNEGESVYLAIAQNLNNTILKFNATKLDFQMLRGIDIVPTSIAVGNNGTVYVSEASLTVTKINPPLMSDISTFSILSNPEGRIDAMVIDSKNNLYAADKALDRVYKYDLTDNRFIGWLGKCTSSINPPNKTLCNTDSMHSNGFVCDDDTCFNNDGKSFGRDIGQFFEPTSLTIDGLNNIYVADVKLSRDNAAIDDPMIELDKLPDGTCPGGTIEFSETTCREIFNMGNVPRVQKFTQNGFFVNKVISDTNQTLVRGNFEWVNGMAYGTNNFYVVDVEKLHVFDVNPFINITTNTVTNQTTAEVTYESFTDLVGDTDMDTFLYKVFDGFADSNVALVNITMIDPDPDGDGILGDIDTLPNTPSLNFSSPTDGTNGRIVNSNNQDLTIREDRDVEKGVYTQANIIGPDTPATIRYCDDLAEVILVPGNRLIATCTMGGENKEEVLGVELEILRGEIKVTFYDREGRNSTSQINLDNTIHFSPIPFEFITPKSNLDIINQTVHFNGKTHSYLVPKDSKVRIDTAKPLLPTDNCSIPLTLEASTTFGVDLSGEILDNEKRNEFLDWLSFTAIEVDNGSTPETDGDQIEVTSNVTSIENRKFPHNGGIIPTITGVEFFTVDKIGNNATCTNFINVRDTTDPILDDLPDIMNITGRFSEVGNAFFDLPKIKDLPDIFGGERQLVNMTSKCSPISGSEFRIGNTTVVCLGFDLSANSNSTSFTVVISPNKEGLTINNVIAAGKSPGLKNGDNVLVEFTVPTNQPPVATIANLNTLFNITNGTFGTDASGKFIDPSNLLITINDKTSADLVLGTTEFDLRFTDDFKLLQSASGVLNSTGANRISNPIILTGSFSTPLAPYITSFVVTDPSPDASTLNDDEYSIGDEFTIRFSVPTNAPGLGQVFTKDEVGGLFDFSPHDLGEEYVGTWKNRSTFIITITNVTEVPSKEPTLGSTLAKVVGDIKNKKETSLTSTSVSPFLSGGFGELYSILEVNENRTFVQDLPSGQKLGISFPIINYTTVTTINGTDVVINYNSTAVFLKKSTIDLSSVIPISDAIDITTTNSTGDCVLGCEISFYIHISDISPLGISVNELRIFHDQNNDAFLDLDELLRPKIESISNELFRISVTVTSFSTIALVGLESGGGGGDKTSPIILGASLGGGGSFVDLDEIHFENNVEKSIVTVGEEYKVKVTLYENSGPDALQHISLYTDLRGFEREIHHSDAYIRYDKGIGVSAYDPQNLFRETDIFILKNGANLEIEFTIIFNKPMEESDLIVRAWDVKRNSVDARFANAIEVISEELSEIIEIPPEVIDEDLINPEFEITIDKMTFEKWGGFSEESISDSELLAQMGIEGNSIPEWYKKIVTKWIHDGTISYEEFVNAIKFFEKRGLLGNS